LRFNSAVITLNSVYNRIFSLKLFIQASLADIYNQIVNKLRTGRVLNTDIKLIIIYFFTLLWYFVVGYMWIILHTA